MEYKSKIKNFARKIDKWHESNVLKRQQTFEADSEFRFELQSPDHIAGFASSSDDELGRDIDGGSAHDSKPSSYHQLPSSMASKRGRKVQDRVRAGKKGYERQVTDPTTMSTPKSVAVGAPIARGVQKALRGAKYTGKSSTKLAAETVLEPKKAADDNHFRSNKSANSMRMKAGADPQENPFEITGMPSMQKTAASNSNKSLGSHGLGRPPRNHGGMNNGVSGAAAMQTVNPRVEGPSAANLPRVKQKQTPHSGLRRQTLGPSQHSGVVSRSNSKSRTFLVEERDAGRAQPSVVITSKIDRAAGQLGGQRREPSVDSYGRRYNQTTTKKARPGNKWSGSRGKEIDEVVAKMLPRPRLGTGQMNVARSGSKGMELARARSGSFQSRDRMSQGRSSNNKY